MRKKMLWFDETKILVQKSKHYVCWAQDTANLLVNTITVVKHGGGSIKLFGQGNWSELRER